VKIVSRFPASPSAVAYYLVRQWGKPLSRSHSNAVVILTDEARIVMELSSCFKLHICSEVLVLEWVPRVSLSYLWKHGISDRTWSDSLSQSFQKLLSFNLWKLALYSSVHLCSQRHRLELGLLEWTDLFLKWGWSCLIQIYHFLLVKACIELLFPVGP